MVLKGPDASPLSILVERLFVRVPVINRVDQLQRMAVYLYAKFNPEGR